MHKEEKNMRLYQIRNGKNWTSASRVMLLTIQLSYEPWELYPKHFNDTGHSNRILENTDPDVCIWSV